MEKFLHEFNMGILDIFPLPKSPQNTAIRQHFPEPPRVSPAGAGGRGGPGTGSSMPAR